MRYGKHKRKVSYALEDLQKARDLASDEDKESCQQAITEHFFGSRKPRKSKKERRRERRKERQKIREDDYV